MEKPTIKAEQQLQEIARKAEVSMKSIYALCNQVYIEEANYAEKLQRMRQLDLQHKQMNLMEIQTSNEKLNQILLTAKLQRHVNRLNRVTKFKSFFKIKRHGKTSENL